MKFEVVRINSVDWLIVTIPKENYSEQNASNIADAFKVAGLENIIIVHDFD